VEVVIVGGLAGSGKTTTILRMAKIFNDAGRRIGIIVQETGDVDYDEDTLLEMNITKKNIESVCIPCSLDADIISNIKSLYEEFKPDIVFIEAEETVLPIRIKADLQRMELKDMHIAPIIIIVDASEFPLETDMLLRFTRIQIENANIICLNKVDKAHKERIAQLTHMLKKLNSYAYILELDAESDECISVLVNAVAEAIH
jgi:G3E family GTPase